MFAPYMGALAAAGCVWSARRDPRYSGKWAWLARCGRCTASSWAQRAVCVDWGLSIVSILQQTVFYTLNMLIIQSNSLVAKAVQLHTSTVNKTRVI